MFAWLTSNWTTILLLLVVLACPLIHALGGHGGRHRYGPPAEKPRA